VKRRVEGKLWRQPQQQQAPGWKEDPAVHASVYGKTQAEPKANTQRQWGEEEGTGLVHLLELDCLATYIGYMSRVSTFLCQG
jgi:hypothetical protein